MAKENDGLATSPDWITGVDSKTVLNSPGPVAKFCYKCNRVVWTKIKYYPTQKTRVIAAGLSLCFLCWVPFFFHWKSEVDHHCSFCNNYLGTYNPLYEQKFYEGYSTLLPVEKTLSGKKQKPQKKYREVGRRCIVYKETIAGKEEIIRVYSNVLQ
ncbi:hypothetical protein RUM44_013772 [Polyplax serrata]|uniref:LITAF domain-containing protein n=1 Tax=Polyplax serrata TaxID=468196 RepID=A0ABR1BGZ6_POLSC